MYFVKPIFEGVYTNVENFNTLMVFKYIYIYIIITKSLIKFTQDIVLKKFEEKLN